MIEWLSPDILLSNRLPHIVYGLQKHTITGMMSKIKVFVTGATGMVGLHLVQFLLSKGHQVVACLRQSSRKDMLTRLIDQYPGQLSYVIADITQPEELSAHMTDCQSVIHTAAAIETLNSPEYLRTVNVNGTNNVLKSAITAGVKHFVHISSLSVITGDQDQYGIDESHSPVYCREAYANSKIDAEKIVMSELGQNQIQVTVLRPGFIYGPYERSWMPKLIKAIKNRRAMLVGNTMKETNVIYVENLCWAINSALLNTTAYGQIYNLTDGQLVTKKLLFDTICDQLNLPRVTLTIPTFAARLLVESSSLIAPIAPIYLKTRLDRYSRAAFRLVAVNQGFDISKAERELGYTNRIPFAEGMSKTLATWNQA